MKKRSHYFQVAASFGESMLKCHVAITYHSQTSPQPPSWGERKVVVLERQLLQGDRGVI